MFVVHTELTRYSVNHYTRMTTANYGTPYDFGTVFQILPDGTGFTVLRRFTHDDGALQSPYCRPATALYA
jgi:hypothetical protein